MPDIIDLEKDKDGVFVPVRVTSVPDSQIPVRRPRVRHNPVQKFEPHAQEFEELMEGFRVGLQFIDELLYYGTQAIRFTKNRKKK